MKTTIAFLIFCSIFIAALKQKKRNLNSCSSCNGINANIALTNAFVDYYRTNIQKIIPVSDGGAVQYYLINQMIRITKVSSEGNFMWSLAKNLSSSELYSYGIQAIEIVPTNSLVIMAFLDQPNNNNVLAFIGKYNIKEGFEISSKLINFETKAYSLFSREENWKLLQGKDKKTYIFNFMASPLLQLELKIVDLTLIQVNEFIKETGIDNTITVSYIALDHNGDFVVKYKKNSASFLSIFTQSADGHLSLLKNEIGISMENILLSGENSIFSDKWIIANVGGNSFFIFSWNTLQVGPYMPSTSRCNIGGIAAVNKGNYILAFINYIHLNSPNLEIYQFNEEGICTCPRTITGAKYYFDNSQIVPSTNERKFFFSGNNIIATIDLDSKAIDCFSPQINYFNTCKDPVDDPDQCHKQCPIIVISTSRKRGCLVKYSSEHCIIDIIDPYGPAKATVGFPARIGSGLLPKDATSEEQIPVIFNNCHPLCGGICAAENDPLKCLNYCSHIDPLIDDSKQHLGECRCKTNYKVSLIYKKCCRNFCNELCLNDECGESSNMCLSCKASPGVKSEQAGYYHKCSCEFGYRLSRGSCVKLTIEDLMIKNNINRCLGMEVVPIISNQLEDGIITYNWLASFKNTPFIPSSFLSSLAAINGSTNKTLVFPHDSLAPGTIIQITLKINESTGLMATKTTDFYIPDTLNKTYCSPCQFYDRSNCKKFDKICWDSCTSIKETPKISSNLCLLFMANICNKIWASNGKSDPQCKEYLNLIDYDKMNEIPKPITAEHIDGIGINILVTFDIDVNYGNIQSCFSVLKSETILKLGSGAICYWKSPKEYMIKYSGENGPLTILAIKKGIIYSSYPFAQNAMNDINLTLNKTIRGFNVSLLSPKNVSPYTTLKLVIIPDPLNGASWNYAWILEYITVNNFNNDKKKIEKFFGELKKFSCLTRIISIPSSYLIPNSILKVTINAINSYLETPFVKEALINITDSDIVPIVEFSSNQAHSEQLFGNLKNIIDINLKYNFLTRNNFENKVEQKIWFEVRTGQDRNNLIIRGNEEIDIEKTINSRYQNSKIFSVSASDNFKYYTHYNITVYSQFSDSNLSSSDSLTVFFIRKPPKCKITTNGYILNSENKNILSSSSSILDYGLGDTVTYFWNCEECQPFIQRSACSCNIFRHLQENRVRDLEIFPKMMSDLSRYKISLSISVINNHNFSSSCYSTIEIVTMSQSIPGIALTTLPRNHVYSPAKSEIFFGADLSSIPDLHTDIQNIEWELIEIINKSNSYMKYSNKNEYYSKIIKRYYDIDTKKRILQESSDQLSSKIPISLIPRILTSPKALPAILGIARDDLMAGFQYTYNLIISLNSSKQAVYGSIDFESPPPIPSHNIFVAPESGLEYQTLFAFTFSSPFRTSIAEASYELQRKDCPENQATSFIPFTTILKNKNSFSSILAPGQKSCNYQISIKLRIIVGDDEVEAITSVIVFPDEDKARNNSIKSLLKELELRNCIYSIPQALSMLNQISLAENLDEEMLLSIMAVLTKYDSIQIESILASFDSDAQVSFYEQLLRILDAMLKNSQQNLSQNIIGKIVKKINNYIDSANSIQGGVNICEIGLEVLDTVCNILSVKANSFSSEFNKQLYSDMISMMDTFVDLKLVEIIPGGHIFKKITKNLAITINSYNFSSFKNNTIEINALNQTLYLPNQLLLQYSNISQKCEPYDCVISTILYSTSFNPYIDIKDSTIINSDYLNVSSTYKSKIQRIYSEFRNSSKLNSVVNKQQVYSKFLIFSLRASTYSLQSNQKVINVNISIDKANNLFLSKAQILLADSAVKVSGLKIPVYYIASQNSWSNSGCILKNSSNNTSEIDHLGLIENSTESFGSVACGPLQFADQLPYSRPTLVLAIDSLENIDEIIKVLDNCQKPRSSWKQIAIVIFSSGILFIVIVLGYAFYKWDINIFLQMTEEALSFYKSNSEPNILESHNFLVKLANFSISVRNMGYYSITQQNNAREGNRPNRPSYEWVSIELEISSNECFPLIRTIINLNSKRQNEFAEIQKILHDEMPQNIKAITLHSSIFLRRLSIGYIEDKKDLKAGNIWGFIKVILI